MGDLGPRSTWMKQVLFPIVADISAVASKNCRWGKTFVGETASIHKIIHLGSFFDITVIIKQSQFSQTQIVETTQVLVDRGTCSPSPSRATDRIFFEASYHMSLSMPVKTAVKQNKKRR